MNFKGLGLISCTWFPPCADCISESVSGCSVRCRSCIRYHGASFHPRNRGHRSSEYHYTRSDSHTLEKCWLLSPFHNSYECKVNIDRTWLFFRSECFAGLMRIICCQFVMSKLLSHSQGVIPKNDHCTSNIITPGHSFLKPHRWVYSLGCKLYSALKLAPSL